MRRLLFLCLIACLLVTGPAAVAQASADGLLSAAAYNKKKCKKAKTKKQKKKYCTKKKPGRNDGGDPPPPPPPPPPPGDPNAVVRDDAGFTNALVGSKLNKTSEGSYGYGEYTWNFCAGGAWSYRSYYYAGSTAESNDGGSYQGGAG